MTERSSSHHGPRAAKQHGSHGGHRGGARGSAGRGPQRRGDAERRPGRAVEPLHPTAEPPDIPSFSHWELGPEVQGAIASMGIQVPTPIQRLAIGPVLAGRDVIAKAETGTGKTLAFGAPIVAKLDPARASVLALILCPTRELAQQVANTLEVLGRAKGLKTALVVGGEPMQGQVQALQKGAQIVVGTPGRVLDLYGQRFLSFPWTEFVVLDEADEMLEIGFIDDVKKILGFTPEERQTLLFSATFPSELLALARESTREPAEVATAAGVATVKTIEQVFMRAERDDRALALIRLIEQSDPEDVFLVFCDRRTEVDALMRRLSRLPFSIKALHGGYDQPSRFRVMGAFRTGEVKALVATDVAARGLDVAHVTHVVNYSVPHDVSSYTHRIGRTGRAGRSGMAVTLVSPENHGRWRDITAAAPWDIPEVPLPGPYRARGAGPGGPPRGAESREREPAREDADVGFADASPAARETRAVPGGDIAAGERTGRGARHERRTGARPERREESPLREAPATRESAPMHGDRPPRRESEAERGSRDPVPHDPLPHDPVPRHESRHGSRRGAHAGEARASVARGEGREELREDVRPARREETRRSPHGDRPAREPRVADHAPREHTRASAAPDRAASERPPLPRRAEPAPEERSRPARGPSEPDSAREDDAGRPRRALSTRERLRLEREGRPVDAPVEPRRPSHGSDGEPRGRTRRTGPEDSDRSRGGAPHPERSEHRAGGLGRAGEPRGSRETGGSRESGSARETGATGGRARGGAEHERRAPRALEDEPRRGPSRPRP